MQTATDNTCEPPSLVESVSQLASEADDRGAQLALAVETLADEVDCVLREVAELRAMVAEQRVVLDELTANARERRAKRRREVDVQLNLEGADEKDSMMKRILIATDGSPAARHAVEVGVKFAKREHGAVAFVYVVPVMDLVPMDGFGMVGHVPHEPTQADEDVLDEAKEAAEREHVPAISALRRGDAVAEIIAYADTLDAELIVVGSRRHGAIVSTLLGSVSRGVLAGSQRPVLIVRAAPAAEPVAA